VQAAPQRAQLDRWGRVSKFEGLKVGRLERMMGGDLRRGPGMQVDDEQVGPVAVTGRAHHTLAALNNDGRVATRVQPSQPRSRWLGQCYYRTWAIRSWWTLGGRPKKAHR